MIHNACHFQFKVGFCVFGGIAKFRVSVAHTLMRRYVLMRKIDMEVVEANPDLAPILVSYAK